jgi:Zn-dependent M28 family amino/carboxypeptidase
MEIEKIPVIGISNTVYTYIINNLKNNDLINLKIISNSIIEIEETFNIICDILPIEKVSDEVLIIGSHLDSHPESPGKFFKKL